MIHEEICTYEVCKLAKEKGFPQHIGDDAYITDNEYYDDTFIEGHLDRIEFIPDYYPTVTAPTQSLLQRWLREEKKIYVCPCIISDYEDDYTPHIVYWSFIIVNTESGDSIYREYERVDDKRFDTYEQALEDALKYALENLV